MRYYFVGLALLSILLPGAPAAAKHSGNICQTSFSDSPAIERDQYGVHNMSTALNTTVWCPIDRRALGNAEPERFLYLTVKFYDRNSTLDVQCTAMTLDSDGNVLWSATRSSGGIHDAPSHELLFNPPSEQNNMLVQCVVPPAENGSFSHIASIYWSQSGL